MISMQPISVANANKICAPNGWTGTLEEPHAEDREKLVTIFAMVNPAYTVPKSRLKRRLARPFNATERYAATSGNNKKIARPINTQDVWMMPVAGSMNQNTRWKLAADQDTKICTTIATVINTHNSEILVFQLVAFMMPYLLFVVDPILVTYFGTPGQ